ncbi:MAG: hypothetical protein OEV06_07870, partial [Anaerolineae bacterium]|nr:hypothetical protein [Anaerolineae bacterium]
FPKLVSGPIERARIFLPQLSEARLVDDRIARRSVMLILVGLTRTAIFADILLIIMPFNLFSDPLQYGNLELVMWLFAFALVLYNQFAGYTNIVRGISGLFGIELSPNFAQPFFSKNFSDFWTRWHISLSQWLRDYVFLPSSRFFLRRNPSRRNVPNIIIPPMATMLISGLWHGARPNLLLWGAIMGSYMVAEQILNLFQRLDPSKKRAWWKTLFSSGVVLGLGLLAAIPFKLDILNSKIYLYGIIKAENWYIPPLWPLAIFAAYLAFDYAQFRAGDEFVFLRAPRWSKAVGMAVVIIVMFVVDNLQAAYLPFTYP